MLYGTQIVQVSFSFSLVFSIQAYKVLRLSPTSIREFPCGRKLVSLSDIVFRYHRDPVWMKVFVGVLFLADTLNAMFSAGWIFKLMIIEFSNLQAYLNADWRTSFSGLYVLVKIDLEASSFC
jgi:hypothetical protein